MDKKHKFNEQVETALASVVVNEYKVSKTNRTSSNTDYEAVIDMMECNRNEKDYEWMSDIFMPEIPAHILTDAAGWVNQYYSTRDFVEVYLEGEDPIVKYQAEAAKKCINKTLNNKGIYHYYKYLRSRLINALRGEIYVICYWERRTARQFVGMKYEQVDLDVDVYGNTMFDSDIQTPAQETREMEQYEDVPIVDRFNYEVLDPRNVFTDNKYTYSAQQRDWITVRSEKMLDDLVSTQRENGYINLNLIRDALSGRDIGETTTKTETEGANKTTKEDKPVQQNFDVIERYGRIWAKIKDSAEDGYPLEISPGYDEHGKPLDNAKLVEAITTFALIGTQQILIRFQPTPFRTPAGEPFKPLVHGVCYVHPTRDDGLSDGQFLRELQIAINDTMNLSADRTKLATLPTLKGRRLALQDNDSIYIEPEHVIELDSPDDIEELKISDNIDGAIKQISMLKSGMHEVSAIWPTTMGGLGAASTTATAIAGSTSRTEERSNLKSLSFEHIFLVEFYTQILYMIFQFASPDTAVKLMGEELAAIFEPESDYTYKPVTGSIEAEQGKNNKIKMWDQILGRVVAVPNPKTPMLINYIIGEVCKLMGSEYEDFADMLLDENVPIEQGGSSGGQESGMAPAGQASNQYGIQQGTGEQSVR